MSEEPAWATLIYVQFLEASWEGRCSQDQELQAALQSQNSKLKTQNSNSGCGGIDLSVGGIVSLSGLSIAFGVKAGLSPFLASLVGVVFGGLLGLVNGLLVTKFRLLPLIATLGTFYAYNGLSVALTDGAPITGLPTFFGTLGRASVAGIPLPTVFIVLPAFFVLEFVLWQMPVGRWIYAIGGNERACRLVGLPVDLTGFIPHLRGSKCRTESTAEERLT